MYYIVGLGNPGEEYEGTRHNTGRMAVEVFRKKQKFSDWEKDKKKNALISEGKIKKEKVMLLVPDTFMNKSGASLKSLITSVKKAENLAVIYDDLDLPVGTMKLSFDRGSGGHRGLESVIKSIKTKKFLRIRVGIAPATPKGKVKKPNDVIDHILGKYKKPELEKLKKVFKKAGEAMEVFVTEGRGKAMGEFN